MLAIFVIPLLVSGTVEIGADTRLLAKTLLESPGYFLCFSMVTVVVVPAIEEFLFRGVLYRGFTNTLNQSASAVLVTTLFVLMHLPSVYENIFALIGVTFLAIGTIVARLLSNALGPPIAFHVAYNLVIVCIAAFRMCH